MAMSSSSTWGMTSRKPPKCAPMKKVGVDRRDRTDGARLQKGDQPADVGVIAPVLHDGEDPAGALRRFDQLPRLSHAGGERFFTQDVAAVLQGDQCDGQMGLGDRAIEDDVGSGLCQYLHQIRPNDSPIPAILGGAVSGSSRVDINKSR